MMEIKRAILLTAGYGSRLWPLTKVVPKSLLNIVDKPVIQYIIEEIADAGIKEVVIVTGPDRSQNLFHDFIDHEIRSLFKINFIFRVQHIPTGMLDAIYHGILPIRQAQGENNEPIAVLVGDDILMNHPSPLKQIVGLYQKTKKPIVALYKIDKSDAHKYGMVGAKKIGGHYKINNVIEKPKTIAQTPSDLSIFGRYILTPELFTIIKKICSSKKEELYLPDAFKIYLEEGKELLGKTVTGERFDAGSMIGLLKSQVYFGLKNKGLKKEFSLYLRKTLQSH